MAVSGVWQVIFECHINWIWANISMNNCLGCRSFRSEILKCFVHLAVSVPVKLETATLNTICHPRELGTACISTSSKAQATKRDRNDGNKCRREVKSEETKWYSNRGNQRSIFKPSFIAILADPHSELYLPSNRVKPLITERKCQSLHFSFKTFAPNVSSVTT